MNKIIGSSNFIISYRTVEVRRLSLCRQAREGVLIRGDREQVLWNYQTFDKHLDFYLPASCHF
jgi:hypothetical protein